MIFTQGKRLRCFCKPKIVTLQNCSCAFNRFRRLRMAQPMFMYSYEQLIAALNQQNRPQWWTERQWLQKDNQIQREAAEECKRKISDLERSANSICESFLILIFFCLKEKNMKEDLKQLTAPLRYRKKKSKEDTKTLSTNSTALLKRKSTLHKNKPGVSGGGGGGGRQPNQPPPPPPPPPPAIPNPTCS